MIEDTFKPVSLSGGGQYNIKYCPKCEKYQHFRRYRSREKCSVCGHLREW